MAEGAQAFQSCIESMNFAFAAYINDAKISDEMQAGLFGMLEEECRERLERRRQELTSDSQGEKEKSAEDRSNQPKPRGIKGHQKDCEKKREKKEETIEGNYD